MKVTRDMDAKKMFRRLALGLTALPVAMLGSATVMTGPMSSATAALPAVTVPAVTGQIVALRRLTETQYRNTIADIFGPDIKVAGRFEPILRPTNELLSVTAAVSTISPAGLEQFDAIGRNIAEQVFDASRRDLFIKCRPADEKASDSRCASEVLTPIGRYLFRRPLTVAEQALYVKIASDSVQQVGGFYNGLKLALSSMLTSPNFLYVIESGEADPSSPGNLRLDNYARASRLSFFLWDTTPNEALLTAAAQGRLTNQAQLGAIATRMANSPRVEGGVRAFFTDMLLFEKFDDLSKDPVVFPRYNGEVAAALPEQMLRMLVDTLVTRGAPYPEIFTTRRTFINRALGPVYEVPVRASAGWVPYEFGPNDDRSGILGTAGFLAVGAAQVGRSSPTNRGRTIREQLLCQEVPNPPGNVSFDAFENHDDAAKPTARMRLASHNTDPMCAACHTITDPIGLALEKFDGLGSFRAKENGATIDASGHLDGVKYNNVTGLGRALAGNKDAMTCVVARLYEYATGRPKPEAGPLVANLEKNFAAAKYRFPALLQRIASMPEAYRIPATLLSATPNKVTFNINSAKTGS